MSSTTPPKIKSGKSFRRRNHNKCPTRPDNKFGLLLRLSSPGESPASGTRLIERIGGLAKDAESTLTTDSGQIDGMNLSLPFSVIQHPGDTERFLEFAIGTPSAESRSPSGSVHACLTDPLKPLNFSTGHRPVKVEDTPNSVPSSPTQTAATDRLPSANLTLGQGSLTGDKAMPLPSPSAIEECKKHLIPVLLAAAQARDSGRRLDSEQCRRLLSDDHCINFIRKAKEMKRQMSFLLSQETPVYQGRSGSLKRDRVDVDAWVRNTRTRFNSVNTIVSDMSGRDSDITMVDVTAGRKSPPKAPRAMLQAIQLHSIDGAQNGAPAKSITTSPTSVDPSASLAELVHQAVQMFPTLEPTSQAATGMDVANVSEGPPIPHPSAPPAQTPPRIQPATATSTDFVSHLPTQPGTWFRQQGRPFAEIVNVDFEVSDDMFYLSRERQPSRVRMHIRLCSVHVAGAMNTDRDDSPVVPPLADAVDDAIERHIFRWPKKGKLVVQINPDTERTKTWLPHTLESDPLDVTSSVQPGRNVFRFIQLSDLSEFTFVLIASPPPPEEAWRSWDWASFADSLARSSDDDLGHDLSELSHIPVTIRS